MSMIQISNDNLEKLESYKILLEDENIIQTLDFILNAFDKDIKRFIREYVMIKNAEEYENTEEYKEFSRKLDKLFEKLDV